METLKIKIEKDRVKFPSESYESVIGYMDNMAGNFCHPEPNAHLIVGINHFDRMEKYEEKFNTNLKQVIKSLRDGDNYSLHARKRNLKSLCTHFRPKEFKTGDEILPPQNCWKIIERLLYDNSFEISMTVLHEAFMISYIWHTTTPQKYP